MTGFFIDHLWLVPVLPLFGALAILVLGRRLGEPKSGWLASFMTIGSFLITVAVFFNLLSRPAEERHQVVTCLSGYQLVRCKSTWRCWQTRCQSRWRYSSLESAR
jgi:NADH:ubiquinone oxidoreductase subunit 5 (subunit L)/multisubunit Na+/H+ antiporter MnhA subunit